MSLWSSEVNCHISRFIIYIKVLVIIMLFYKDEKKLFITFYLQIDGQIER